MKKEPNFCENCAMDLVTCDCAVKRPAYVETATDPDCIASAQRAGNTRLEAIRDRTRDELFSEYFEDREGSAKVAEHAYRQGWKDRATYTVVPNAPTQGADARPVAMEQIEKLAREVEVECLAGSGVSFYMVAEMAIERTIEMLAGPSMQIAEVCQDADGFKHVESVIEDLDDLPAGMKLYATTQRNHG